MRLKGLKFILNSFLKTDVELYFNLIYLFNLIVISWRTVMKNIKVSIIVPVYNVENYLRQCLDSVLNQTLKEIEVICVNDGSTDNSKQILEAYRKKDSRIKIINKKNAGQGAARNRGIEYAKGEYIGFVDSDDWIDINMFEKLYKNAKFNNSDIVMCPILLINETDGNLNREIPYFDLKCFDEGFDDCVFNYKQTKNFIHDITVNVYNKIFRREFINNINARFPEGLIFEDVPFFYQTYLGARRISLIRDYLYFHRVNRPSSTIALVDKRHFDIIKIQNIMIEHFSALPNFEEFKIELLNKKIFRITRRYFEFDNNHRKEFFKLIKHEFKKMNLKDDEINDLHPSMSKYYQNIINSSSYKEFELKNVVAQNKQTFKNNNRLKSTDDDLQQEITKDLTISAKFKNFITRIKNKNILYSYILFNRKNNGIKNTLINIKGYRAIRTNHLFDTTYYLKNNSDVKLSGMNPILHYIYHGFKESRIPNPSFDGNYYLKIHKDVKKSNLNPLVHYSLYGINEGRKIRKYVPKASKHIPKVQKKSLTKKLIISFCFTPYMDTSANVMAKRIRENNEVVDVIQNNMRKIRGIDNSSSLLTHELIEDQIIINSHPFFGSWYHINDFCKKGMEKINENIKKKGEYEEIYSRAMFPASHFLAFEYKLKYPNVKWIAEFSDPIIYDTEGKIRYSKINDQEFLDKVNKALLKNGFSKYKEANLFFLCEYLPYAFADELIFTNENQKEFMIDKFPIPKVKDLIKKKGSIKRHPTLKNEFYHLIKSNYSLDKNCVNIAYFGRDYETRNLDDVFQALYGLEKDYQDKCKIHFFTSDIEGFRELMDCNPINENLEVNPYVNFLEFLSLTTKFDCLIVNDAHKKQEINPYLPSKLSDYLGSGTNIWILYEEGSAMSKFDVKYNSPIGDIKLTRQTLKQIIQDHKN